MCEEFVKPATVVIDLLDDDNSDDVDNSNNVENIIKQNIVAGCGDTIKQIHSINQSKDDEDDDDDIIVLDCYNTDKTDKKSNVASSSASTNLASVPNCDPQFLNLIDSTDDEIVVGDNNDNDDIEIEQMGDFCLRWKLYDSNLKSILSNFLSKEQFVDVTLACETQSIKCHKVILSANSPYFENLFKKNPSSDLIVSMDDLSFWEVKSLIEFMYNGEVVVPRYKLDSLLDAAAALGVKGLAEPTPKKFISKNYQLNKSVSKKPSNKIYNQEKKLLTVRNIRSFSNSRKILKDSVNKLETSTQTTPEFDTFDNVSINYKNNISIVPNSNFIHNFLPSQVSLSDPNVYTVFTQTLSPYVKTNSLNRVDNSSVQFPLLVHPSNPGSHLISQQPDSNIIVSEPPQSTVSSINNGSNSYPFQKTYTVSFTASTQTSPLREDLGEGDINTDDELQRNRLVGNPSKRKKVSHSEQKNERTLNVSNKDKQNKRALRRSRRRLKRNKNSIENKINCLIRTGDTNVMFTRKKYAELESIANRTRKRQSEVVKKRILKIFH